MNTEVLAKFTDVAVIAALLTAVLGGGAIVWQTWYQRSKTAGTARDALFAELGHIETHYKYTSAEILSVKSQRPLPLRLSWAKFGKVSAAEHVREFAILGAFEMESLLQLSFMIRNTDLLLDTMISSVTDINGDELEYLTERMRATQFNARAIMEYMAGKESRYEPLLRVARAITGYI